MSPPPLNNASLLGAVRKDFLMHADEVRAEEMRAYMKSSTPFYGIPAAVRRKLSKPHIKAHRAADADSYQEHIIELWEGTHREEHYTALDYARAHPRFITLDHIDLFAQLVREGAWWDHVDVIASHLVGGAVRKRPDEGFEAMDVWIEDDNLWIRRAALLCQLGFKQDTDAERLFAYCRTCMHDEAFFIRKAIGWALRQYASIAPQDVRDFVDKHRDDLSGLSRREALKRLTSNYIDTI